MTVTEVYILLNLHKGCTRYRTDFSPLPHYYTTINDNRLVAIIGSRRDLTGRVTGLHSMLINGYNGSEITIDAGFYIPAGSTLDVNVVSDPCN